MKKLIFVFLWFTFILVIFAQNKNVSVNGVIIDAVTKQPIIGANITIVGTDKGTAADINGEYKIYNLSPDSYILKVSAVGYESKIKTDVVVNPAKPTQLDFELIEKAVELENITVTADYFSRNPTELLSTRNFSYEEIRRSPGGFEDVIRSISGLPGVAQADAGRNDLIVRGGAPSENLFVVDGIQVPNINHFGTQGATGGPLSYINLDFVKNVDFSTGGFPVMYGDRLSSVLNIDLRKGRSDKIGGKATISASQFGLNLEGPFSEENSFIFSARRSYLDFIFKAAGFGFVPEYYDFLSKADFKLSGSSRISYLLIGAFDKVKYFNETADQKYDNSRILGSDQTQYLTGVTYEKLFKNGFFKIILSRNYSSFNTSQKDSLLNPIFINNSTEAENSLKGDVIYKFSSASEINIGLEGKFIKFKSELYLPQFITSFEDTLETNLLNNDKNYYKSAAYLNLTHNFNQRIITNLGFRIDYFNPLKNQFYFSPRFSASYKLNDFSNLNFSAGIYYQSPSYIWLSTNNNLKNLKDLKTDQFILGIDRDLREDLQINLEGFVKVYSNYPASINRQYLVLANTGAGFSGSDDGFASFGIEPLAGGGKGISKGLEMSIQKKLSEIPFYGIASLTFSKTEFTALDGIKRPGSYDQEWIINFSGGYKFNKYWETSFKFSYASGKPYTPFNSDGIRNSDKYNSLRLPANHSLNMRADKRWFFDDWVLITYIDIQNIYNHKNISTLRWDERTQSIDESTSFGILPSIGISAEF